MLVLIVEELSNIVMLQRKLQYTKLTALFSALLASIKSQFLIMCSPHPHDCQVVSVEELSDVVEHRLGCSPNFKYFYDPKTKAYQGRPHQYNCTYYSALGGNARHYLLARAIQFFTPGIPMVYYVGMFAGLNDYDVSASL